MPYRAVATACFLTVTSACAGCSADSQVSSDLNPGLHTGGSPGDASSGGSGGSAAAGGSGGSASSTTGGSAGEATGGTAGDDAGGSADDGGSNTGGTGGSNTGGTGGSNTGGTGGNNTGGTGGSNTGGSSGDAGSAVPCTTDAECANGTSCQVVVDDTSTSLVLRCMPLAGANGKGIACASNADCRSGTCLYGYCATPCSTSADCSQAGTCRAELVSVGGLSASFPMCAVLPCTSSTQCDPGEVCSDIRLINGAYAAYCKQANQGASPVGAPCSSAADCASALCPPWLGTCTAVCSGDADCGGNLACVDVYGNGTSVVQGCAIGCDQSSDCTTPAVCQIATDSAGNEHQFVCGTGYGTDPVGADCSTANHCASGLCLQNYVNGQLVSQLCTAPCIHGAADCPSGYQVCEEVNMLVPDGSGSQLLSLCNQ
jgi:hypothetical protein